MSSQDRILRLRSQLLNENKVSAMEEKHADPVVIVSALRTPITKAKRGAFKDTTTDTLLAQVLTATIEQTGLDPASIGDITIGNVLQSGSGAAMARMAQLQAGIPYSVPLHTVNRQCSSGLQAFANVAFAIQSGQYDIGMAGGVESMTKTDMAATTPDVNWEQVYANDSAAQCTTPMGVTSENVAEKFGITRQQQDELAVLSHEKAARAQSSGFFDAEIVPIKTVVLDEEGNEKEIVVSKDEGIRQGTTVERLAKLKASFKENGTTTAGNSSQVSDGAAAVLLMKRSIAQKLNLPILGTFVSFAVAGVPPAIMGIGPAVAIPAALKKANLSMDQIDLFELNEAFASQAIYCIQKLQIPIEKVNPNGGALALGHPLGCTGARQIATLLHELKRQKKKYGVVSMCIGTGMGAAAVFKSSE